MVFPVILDSYFLILCYMVRIAINGFGRIGRLFFRQAFGQQDFEIAAINDLGDVANLAYLLQYDSVYRQYATSVEAKNNMLVVAGREVRMMQEPEPAKLPWKDLGIDIVVESTGFFTTDEAASAHLAAGARHVVITAPAKGSQVTTALVGTNDDRFRTAHSITSNASCTTNSVAPVLAILLEQFGIDRANMVTVHGYTASQKLVDGPDAKDFRRGRAAAENIIPTSTGAAEAVIDAIPELTGRFVADAVRVPVLTGSLSMVTALVERPTTATEVQDLFRQQARDARWSKVLAVAEDPVVSSDIIGVPFGAVVDIGLIAVLGGTMVKVFSWYDNEAGYTATLLEHVRSVIKHL